MRKIRLKDLEKDISEVNQSLKSIDIRYKETVKKIAELNAAKVDLESDLVGIKIDRDEAEEWKKRLLLAQI